MLIESDEKIIIKTCFIDLLNYANQTIKTFPRKSILIFKINFRIIIAVILLICPAGGALQLLYLLADLLEKTFRNNFG
jgi:hypothetical protein